jgi:cell division protein FtsX
LPATTYTSDPVILRANAQGRSVTPTSLLPTPNPTGFMQQPPLALTTLSAAQRLMGDGIIGSIRVRVAGVTQANDASWQRVAHVAQEIEQSTGLRVVVTLGSSPQPTLVSVPGIEAGQDGATHALAPLGWVEERWIALGVDVVYLHQLGETRFLLLGTVLLVCLGYLIVTLSSLVSSQRREFAILSAIGWRPWQPVRLFLTQALLLALGGGMVGIGLAFLIVTIIGASPPWEIIGLALPLVLLLALLSALFPLWQIWHIEPAEVLRAGATVSAAGTQNRLSRLDAHLPAIGSMALRNMLRGRLRALITLASLFLSALLLTVMVTELLAFHQSLQGTLLGSYVLLQTAVPQLAGALFAVVLTFLSVADLLLLQVHERRREIGLLQAIGWRPAQVQRLFLQEGLVLATLGTLPGVLVALLVLTMQHTAQLGVSLLLVAVSVMLLMILVAALAAIPAVRASIRLPLVDVLRAD